MVAIRTTEDSRHVGGKLMLQLMCHYFWKSQSLLSWEKPIDNDHLFVYSSEFFWTDLIDCATGFKNIIGLSVCKATLAHTKVN